MHKKGEPEVVSSLHPVSLTFMKCKIGISRKAIFSLLSDTRTIAPYQQGFPLRRSYLSTLLVFALVSSINLPTFMPYLNVTPLLVLSFRSLQARCAQLSIIINYTYKNSVTTFFHKIRTTIQS